MCFGDILLYESCQDGRRSVICEEEDNDLITTRFYTIDITATDPSGNVSNKKCSVAVVPKGHYHGKGSSRKGKGSSRRYNREMTGNSSKRSKGSGKGKYHDPDDLRREFGNSTQRYIIGELSVEWDSELDTELIVPPLPPSTRCKGSSKGSHKGSSAR